MRLDKSTGIYYNAVVPMEQPHYKQSSGGRAYPAESEQDRALTREPDTDHAVVGKDAGRF